MHTSLSHQTDRLRQWAAAAWLLSDPVVKLERVRSIELAMAAGVVPSPPEHDPDLLLCEHAGHPLRPRLVAPRQVPSRGLGSNEGRAALLHAIAHIEFNAINLALDAAWRFDRMPAEFVLDWLSVAVDEARHFSMITEEMSRRGHAYGDFDAHDGLWQMAWKTRDDVLARMALVPRVMEARGLDATPPMQRRLRSAGDEAAAALLQIILDEEVRHVAIGNNWYHRLCSQRGVDPVETFTTLIRAHAIPVGRGPLNLDARRAAGFSEDELSWLSAPPTEADRPEPARGA